MQVMSVRQLVQVWFLPVWLFYLMTVISSELDALPRIEKSEQVVQKSVEKLGDISLTAQMAAMGSELAALRTDVGKVEAKMHGEFATLRRELREDRYYFLGIVLLLGGTAMYRALKPR